MSIERWVDWSRVIWRPGTKDLMVNNLRIKHDTPLPLMWNLDSVHHLIDEYFPILHYLLLARKHSVQLVDLCNWNLKYGNYSFRMSSKFFLLLQCRLGLPLCFQGPYFWLPLPLFSVYHLPFFLGPSQSSLNSFSARSALADKQLCSH